MNKICAVKPMEGFRLVLEFCNGSSITIDLSYKVKTARFAVLSNKELFNNVKARSETVIWGDGILKITLYELIDIAIGEM
jgi:hypothetical protein